MPAPRWIKLLWQATRWCGASALSFAVWTLWLVLALALAAQTYIATHRELEIPGFLLRSLETRLAASGIRATFGHTYFDPTGRVLIEDARLSLPSFAEPVVTARTIYVRLDPWALAAGRFEPSELRVSGASLVVPAMLSPTGRPEALLRDLDTTLIPHEQELELAQLSARIAGLSLLAHGALRLPPRPPDGAGPLPLAEFLARNYSTISRQLVAAAAQLSALDQPSLQLELAPSDTRIAIASVTLHARSLKLAVPQPVQIAGLRAVTRVPLFGDAPVTARLELTADSVALPFDATARQLRALVLGTLRPGRLQFNPRELELSVASLTASGFTAQAVAARLTPGPLPQISAEIEALILDAPLAVQADADLLAQTATVRFDGAISPAILTPLSARLRLDVRKYFDFAALDRATGEARLGPGWKFETLSARVALRGINAYHVMMEEGRAAFTFDGRHFHATEAWARLGDNFARGTFDQDLTTLRYRFLLAGRLRPLAISGWFGNWWPNIFQQLEFPSAPPPASVEVSGRWTENRLATVFVFADTPTAIIRGAALDSVRTRLFIRPGFYDALELFATHPTGEARGTFTYSTDRETFAWRTLELDLASTLDPHVAAPMIGPAGVALLAPFYWSAPPALTLAGRIDGPAAPGGAHQSLRLVARLPGEFRFQGFPLENLSFTAALRDTDLDLSQMEARFADGTLTGRAQVFGVGPERRVRFDYTLKEASLGHAVAALQDYTARRSGTPPSPPGKFIREKAAVRLDLTAAAEGRYDDPLSYRGEGRAALQGAGLGEVHLLGQLSELFTFTALRFNTAQATFKIDGPRLTFPDVAFRGANSAIDAHGDFALDHRTLDFKAKIFPFQESAGLIKSVVGAVLTPFSNIFEVKLTGTLDKPAWAFVVGPSNILRSLAPGETAPAKPAEPGPAAPKS